MALNDDKESTDALDYVTARMDVLKPLLGLTDCGVPDYWPLKDMDPLGFSSVVSVMPSPDDSKFFLNKIQTQTLIIHLS